MGIRSSFFVAVIAVYIKKQKPCVCKAFVIEKGFEPLTHSLEGCCSIQLSYSTVSIGAYVSINATAK